MAPVQTRPTVTRSDPAAPSRTRPEIGATRGASPTRTTTVERPTFARTRTSAARVDHDAISRLPSAADRAAATRLTRPDERSQIRAATRGTAGAIRPRGTTDGRLAYAPTSLRSDTSRLTTRGTSLLDTRRMPDARRGAPARVKPGLSDLRRTPSRYHDGRYSVYTPPAHRHTPGPYRPSHYDHSPRHHHRRSSHSSFYLNLSIGSGWYTPGWYGPSWYAPAWYSPAWYYPASGFSFSWSNRRYGLSIWNSAPVYATPYYDSWVCGGWGFSSLYYGGWRSGWYGGVSYIYNPWPVYRTTYFYEPAPVVTETVYVTQPAAQTTVVYEEPQTYATVPAAQTTVVYEEPQTYAVATAASPNVSLQSAPASTTAPLLPLPVPAPAEEPDNHTLWDAAPAVAQVETTAIGCFCPCRCNGKRPCICDYPCGAEYAIVREEFNLGLNFASYTDTLNPEAIWASYAGLDRIATLNGDTLYAGSAATTCY
ncbi:MAG TPA: hypothetical protein P5527_07265 [Kiritimatiellia bacterium]|jgi:hypothetical protein|nr:hypothetical protein [Kiritimatiellia bacterium]